MSSQDNNTRAPDINTSYPGHIYNFNAATQTCEVQLAIETLFIGYKEAYTLKPKQRLQGVPVQFIQGGGWSLTHPIPDGTPCYVHFSQRGIDHWLTENKSVAGMRGTRPAPAFSQLFDIKAAVCTIGIQPLTAVIPNFQGSVCELRNRERDQRLTLSGDGMVELLTGAAKITITKDTDVFVETTVSTTVKSPNITLDGDTTVTKSLTVMGGMSVQGSSGGGATMTISGSTKFIGVTDVNGTFSVDGVVVNKHIHSNPEGGNVGPMK